jgi:hypothetical protein
MTCIRLRIIGLHETKEKELSLNNICVDGKVNVLQVLDKVRNDIKIMFEFDEIMIICNNKQLYVNDEIPQDCKELIMFPLALGG